MTIKAIALDDEPPALAILENFCRKVEYVDLQKTFTKAEEALKYLKKYPVDLLFLDINMPSISGIDFHKKIPHKTMVIFTTAYSEFAVEGFNLSAMDYLLKPISQPRFLQSMERVKAQMELENQNQKIEEQFLFVRADYSLMKIPLKDILFVEGLDDYLKIHIDNQKTVVARMTMKSITEKLPASEFARVHRSFIVPMSKIEKIRNKVIFIRDEEIPISASYEKEFLARIQKDD
ncbi:DNA-binding response regulator [Flavobacterium magnum]|uniref:DNA-binding response regulator n=1 Tax=Flavobacterium magnum TaxID=2162713 RepID=A0A2S0RC83_9FLAO|nr:LytTR family DNA-binding domain-containing protein [Flavobacterium magnum]AWA29296.1 DNA-binding response regulator [Flavobacterium magnum]